MPADKTDKKYVKLQKKKVAIAEVNEKESVKRVELSKTEDKKETKKEIKEDKKIVKKISNDSNKNEAKKISNDSNKNEHKKEINQIDSNKKITSNSNKKISNDSNKITVSDSNKKISSDSDSKAKYKRNSSKYSKEKEERTRSNPKYEYNLEDADENEKTIILNGTVNDRINCLALLCARNPSEKNFKQLLMFCERQRNDVIYSTLKLLRDLIKELKIESSYIRDRIVKSFEMGSKNQYIKNKVIEMVGVLIRAKILEEPFIDLLVSRMIEKGETLVLVESALQSIFLEHKDFVFNGLEDFYFKNDNFRSQHNVLKFLQKLEINNNQNFFRFFDTALTSLDDYPQEQKDLMIEILVNSLSKSHVEGEMVTNIEFLRTYVKSARSSISVLSLLVKMNDPYTETFILRLSRTSLLRGTKYEPEFLNMIYNLTNKDMFSKLVDNSFFYSVPSILSLMLIAHEKGVDTRYLFSLHMFIQHYNPLVRDTARRLLNREKMQKFDPFDKIYVEGQSKMISNRK